MLISGIDLNLNHSYVINVLFLSRDAVYNIECSIIRRSGAYTYVDAPAIHLDSGGSVSFVVTLLLLGRNRLAMVIVTSYRFTFCSIRLRYRESRSRFEF